MKKCFKCGKEKELSCFYKHRAMKDGHLNKCKDCTKGDVKSNSKKVGDKYDSSEQGVIRIIYKTQKRNQRFRGHGDLPYSKDELSKWMYDNGYKDLYKKYISSGKVKDLKPSVDRIDDFKGYSLDNIKMVTWLDNREHQYSDIESGKGTSGKRCKALLKLDKDNNIICEYVSYNSAQRDAGYSIEYQIKNGVKCRNGFYWKYL